MQQTALKNAYYSKNDKILKSGKNDNIAWAKTKWSILGRNLKVPKS